MSYATTSDLTDWIGIGATAELTQLTDAANLGINLTLVEAALNSADNRINSYLAGVALPLSEPYPPVVVEMACKLARAFLYKFGRPEYVDADYRDAMQWLDDVRTGKASLGLDGSGTEEVTPSAGCSVSADPVIFTAEQLAVL